uniref:AIG1-type G domain-containing protein n=1 Tax=Chlamydomonas leiostraca TaxID=1034604 RepID=A0A7S0R593_9CHLO|mmetsp:Transcript_14000/g.34500  ORF Transcript_14000/g.34500 Transcript_14000/m.34500 type:complete len:412 (+) Transcript_14000:55-1290(+)|eukprot:CAMPEP_0202869390 /NCGR_PEP_ID=MMETSP1391-20130828/12426_1 /ASSEMBLY_ACC=CAM_ASM_000867 /TAXON_ID=1034604 /ORGANISM="Chlamydomonas leiostraca, Strain SAG 11-49" /LENGTH=411 /DNA_ID=CAMNT_0049549703 /DNA_START=61 /DNA_END=1296 /DNA_ORIENTATION=-
MPPKQQESEEYDDDEYEEEEYVTDEGDEEDYEGKVEEVDEEDEAVTSAQAQKSGKADEEEEEEEEEEESEEEEELANPWNGLGKLPERLDVIQCLADVKGAGIKQLNVLLLGKSSVGKSSTVNSLLGEAVARVQAFKLQADGEIVTPIVKQVGSGPDTEEVEGLRVKLIDTCGLEDPEAGDTVHHTAMRKIADYIKGQPIDCVLYCDRLDLYRVDALDRSIIRAVTDVFGRGIWKKTVLVLTHGNLVQTPPGTDYDSFADRRVKALRKAICGGPLFAPKLPAVLVENNADTCPVDKDGRRLLPDGSQWVVTLADAITEMALGRKPYRYKPSMTRRPNAHLRWLVPLVAAGQYFLWRQLLKPRLDEDRAKEAEYDELVWEEAAKERSRLGLHAPRRPTKENAWRLEQIYDDD